MLGSTDGSRKKQNFGYFAEVEPFGIIRLAAFESARPLSQISRPRRAMLSAAVRFYMP